MNREGGRKEIKKKKKKMQEPLKHANINPVYVVLNQVDISRRRTHEGNAVLVQEFWEFGVFRGMTPTSPHRLAMKGD